MTVAPRTLLLLAVGFTLWASAFVALYGVHALGCAFGWPLVLHRAIMLGLLGLHLAALAWMSSWCWRRWRTRGNAEPRPLPFLELIGFGATIAALLATVFTFAPSFLLKLCVS